MVKLKKRPISAAILAFLLLGSSVVSAQSRPQGDISHVCAFELVANDQIQGFKDLVAQTHWGKATDRDVSELRQMAFRLPIKDVYDTFLGRLRLRDRFWFMAPDRPMGRLMRTLLQRHFVRSPILIFAQILLDHPADIPERREAIWHALDMGDYRQFQLIDELMGISGHQLEFEERTTSQRLADRRQHRSTLGIGQAHWFWFSNYRILAAAAADMQFEKLVVDLGSGSGRLGLLIGFLFPQVQFIGLEIDQERVETARAAAQRWGFHNRIQFFQQDLTKADQNIPDADAYFIYGPTNSETTNQYVISRLEQELPRGRVYRVYTHHPMTKKILARSPTFINLSEPLEGLWRFDMINIQ